MNSPNRDQHGWPLPDVVSQDELLRALEGLLLVAVPKDREAYVNQAKDRVTGEGLYDFARRLLDEAQGRTP